MVLGAAAYLLSVSLCSSLVEWSNVKVSVGKVQVAPHPIGKLVLRGLITEGPRRGGGDWSDGQTGCILYED